MVEFDKLITVQEIVGEPGPAGKDGTFKVLDKAPDNPKVGDIWMTK
ncbi:hypothetical protein [Leuconostoc mesenteroides]|nr:hypothetical protein [Leuconostoc mesenteroides]USI45372.1 hypothetical protein M0D19_07705 [Leuconostoc mesenteroides]